MKNKPNHSGSTLKTVTLIALILTVIAEIVFAVQLLLLNLLPLEYSLLILLVLALVPVLMTLCWYKGGRKPLRYIVLWLLTLVIVAGCIFGSVALNKLQATLDAITGQEEDSSIYVGVYVLKDNAAQSITETGDYIFAYAGSEPNYDPQEAVQGISLLLNKAIVTLEYESAYSAVDALMSGEAGAVLLNTNTAELLEAVEGYESFLSDTRLIYEHAVKEQVMSRPTDPVATEPMEDPTVEIDPTEPTVNIQVSQEPFILYLSGSDTRSSTLRKSRSDVNILAVVNPNTQQILLVNTPRDYYVTLGTTKNSKDKLTHASMYGIKCSVKTMEKLYGCDVSYYARINFSGFETMIDAIGGITVNSDVAFKTDDDIQILAGENHLNGEAALSFARERHHLAGGDNARGKNQMKVIAAVVDKVTSGSTIINKYAEILESLEGMFVTDMPTEKLGELVQFQLTAMPKWQIYSYAVTGSGSSDYTYSIPSYKTYVMLPNKRTVKHATNLIDRVLAGEVLTDADMTTPKS